MICLETYFMVSIRRNIIYIFRRISTSEAKYIYVNNVGQI